jgi:hypothetical protein
LSSSDQSEPYGEIVSLKKRKKGKKEKKIKEREKGREKNKRKAPKI